MVSLRHLFLVAVLFTTAAKADDTQLCSSIKFAVDFYKTVHQQNPTDNVIVSPLSVQTALGLLLMGARGSTAEQIVKGLHLKTNDRSAIASHFEDILRQYDSGQTLKIANKVYTRTGYEVKPEFNEVARKSFKSEAEQISFTNSEEAARTINTWVENHTNNKIKELFKPDQIRTDTRMALVNAVHFKAPWDDPFMKDYTEKRDFWVSATESVQVDMMYNMAPIKYGRNDDLESTIGMIPYKNHDAWMLIILPNSRDGLSELERKLETYDMTNITHSLRDVWVDIRFPKFKVETSLDLKKVLKQMGMGQMFSDSADLTNLLSSGERLKIDQAVHKAYIAVDEEGTEAAAATGMTAVPMSMPPTFVVDHPFFFAIVGQHHVVPFVGSVRHF